MKTKLLFIFSCIATGIGFSLCLVSVICAIAYGSWFYTFYNTTTLVMFIVGFALFVSGCVGMVMGDK